MTMNRLETDVLLLLFGVIAGILIQTAITMTITNGAYKLISSRRIWGMRWMGGVLALSAGLTFLAAQDLSATSSSFDIAYKLWAAQVAAAIAGGEGYRRWREGKEKSGDADGS